MANGRVRKVAERGHALPEATSCKNQSDAQLLDRYVPLLDEELNRLPAKYRAPMVLCGLQGKTYLEAAQELGWPSGSVSRRISKARQLLRSRLTRRGVALSLPLLVALLPKKAAAACVSVELKAATLQGALAYGAAAASAGG